MIPYDSLPVIFMIPNEEGTFAGILFKDLSDKELINAKVLE